MRKKGFGRCRLGPSRVAPECHPAVADGRSHARLPRHLSGGQDAPAVGLQTFDLVPPSYSKTLTCEGIPVQIAILLFDRFTALDVVGPYDVLSHLPGAETVLVAEHPGPVTNEVGSLRLVADATLADVPCPDIVLVPGGPGQTAHMDDGPIRQWLRKADSHTAWTASVCTGSLLLAAAGLLKGRRATTHWLAADQLAPFGVIPAADRVVFDGKYVTAAGVSAGLDMALALAGRIAGDTVAQTIQLAHEYDPQPPYQAGSPATAPGGIVDTLRSRSHLILQ